MGCCRKVCPPLLSLRRCRRGISILDYTYADPLIIECLRSYYAEHSIVCFEISTCHEILSFVPRLPGWFFQRLVYVPLRRSGAPHSLRQAQGCGFPHTQVAKRTAPSDSAELVAGRQSLQKRFHGLTWQESFQWMRTMKCST